jgi:hypothetical protein
MPRKLTDKAFSPTAISDKLGYTPANETDIQNQINNLIDSAPEALDTLNELAAALGDDANFASTVTTALGGKQATLVSGTNIKTINGESVLGSGDLEIAGGSGGAATQVAATANNDFQNYKVPFFKTTGNTSGDYEVSLDSDANQFIYNPGSNILDNVNLGSNTSVQKILSTANGDNANYKVPFANTTSNSSGSYTQLIDSSSNFTYNPSTNTLNNVTLGSSVTLREGGAYNLGAVHGSTSNTSTSYGYDAITNGASESLAIGYSARATAGGATSLGYNARAFGTNSIVIGRNTTDNSRQNTIVLNATGNSFNPSSSGVYIGGLTNGTSNDVLYFDTSTNRVTYGAPSSGSGDVALEDLTNVSISNPTSGQVLKYNGTAWVNSTDETGGDTGGGDGGSQVTSGSGVTYFSGPGQQGFGNITINFDTPTLAATFYNTVTQNFTAISSVSQGLSQGASAYIRIQAPSVSWQGGPALCNFSLSTQSFTYTPGNDYVSGQAFVSASSSGSGSGNWTYNDEAFNWASNVNTFSYGGGQCTVNFYNPTAAEIYAVAAILVPKPPIALGVAGYLTNNFANAFTSFGGVALSGSSPTSSTQFTFTYTSVNFEFPSQGNYIVLSGNLVIPT